MKKLKFDFDKFGFRIFYELFVTCHHVEIKFYMLKSPMNQNFVKMAHGSGLPKLIKKLDGNVVGGLTLLIYGRLGTRM